jgi:hypothetical protein
MRAWGLRALRLLKKPPGYLLRRAAAEAYRELDRFAQPLRERTFSVATVVARTADRSPGALWERLATQSWPLANAALDRAALEKLAPGATAVILERAERALRHEVDLLGSGPVKLGEFIRWNVDFKSGAGWSPGYFRDIPTLHTQRPSDIKVPWELSRLQWLIPAGQAYLLTTEERFAVAARDILQQWLAANPVGRGVNWAIAMEPALRIFSWIWLFRVFGATRAWADEGFRAQFLSALYAHAQFVARNIERAELNGNHFTADCAALVVAGAFFGGEEGARWLSRGLADLEREIVVQIEADGVDFEASSAYHRLVSELFLLAALHAEHRGQPVSLRYRERLHAAALFCAAYTRPDGEAPLWGDADDARALPLGVGSITDHRHLVACTAVFLQDRQLGALARGGWDEALWLYGAAALEPAPPAPPMPAVQAFPRGGVFILRAPAAQVFIDCGRVGLAGRGGHGHNDILSFEATLAGLPVISEGGCYVYTASFEERNYFRSTQAHNTPQIDGEEINRFVSPQLLWLLHEDAQPLAPSVFEEAGAMVFEGGHSGYRRLAQPVTPRRRLELRGDGTAMCIRDTFAGTGSHRIRIPLQLAPGWELLELTGRAAQCQHQSGRRLRISWAGSQAWQLREEQGRVAPSYGVLLPAVRFVCSASAPVTDLALTTIVECS